MGLRSVACPVSLRSELSSVTASRRESGPPEHDASLAVLVNSSRGYRDCWFPFFRLLEIYWPECRFPLYLNVEEGLYQHPSLAVTCLTHPDGSLGTRLPWSDQLLASLEMIPERYVLYMQEDYFLDAPVDHVRLEECLALAIGAGLGCVHLTPYGSHGGRTTAELPYLVDVPRISHYRFSNQAAIWDKAVLASYVRPGESAWETEILGTLRSWSRPEPVRAVMEAAAGGPVMSYTGTGIIRGTWHPAVQPLFEKHGIDIDFSRRGFYDFPSRWGTRTKMLRTLARRPDRPLAALLGQ
jgi:hypothetical protein